MAPRSYGSGSLFFRTDGRGRETWYGSWYVGGRRVKRSIGKKRARGTRDGLTRAQAEKELHRRVEASASEVVARTRKTVAEAGEIYIDHLRVVKRRKRTTLVDYEMYVRRHFAPFFGTRALDRLTPDHLQAYVHEKLGTLAVNTVIHHLNFLHGLLAFGVRQGWLSENPARHVDRPPPGRKHSRRVRFLQPVEIEALLREIPDDLLGPTEGALYICAAMTGLRQGELLALRWRDVDWVAARVRVADNYPRGYTAEVDSPKSHVLRSVPMADRVAAELDRHFQRSFYRSPDDLVFCHPQTGGVCDASKVRKRFDQTTRRANVNRITFHELRHTFGTQMAAAGAPLRAIQEWLGHADAKTTEIYAHYAPDSTNGAAFAAKAFGAPLEGRDRLTREREIRRPDALHMSVHDLR